jgi:sigma-E factor negative regulatory protein RseB
VLLERAAEVSRNRSWRGTQSVLSTHGDMPRYQVRSVVHEPGAGSSVVGLGGTGNAVAPDLLDEDLFTLLERNYDLVVVGDTLCDGRPTVLVEARRPGRTGEAAVAGRFWIDRATQMVWRRDVLDDRGATVVSTAFSDLGFTRDTTPGPPAATSEAGVTRLDDAALADLVDDGWPIVDHLPDGLERFDALRHPDGVVQLSYSDGLSTLSLFVQKGALPEHTGGTLREIGTSLVHVSSTEPEQLVWAGAGRTWTLVSDASDATIEQAVLVLPHADDPVVHEGLGERVWRGMSKVGAWLNPFD